MPRPAANLLGLLTVLAENRVDFIVIGGVAAALQGAPIATFDLDLVHSREPDNLERLLAALCDLDASYREHHDPRLTPTAAHLSGPGHHLLMTSAGPLDLLGTVTNRRGYADLVASTFFVELTPGLSVRVLDLAMIITLKSELAGEKDLAQLPILRRTLEERRTHPGPTRED